MAAILNAFNPEHGTDETSRHGNRMNFKIEIETLIRARYPILYIISSEEIRVQNLLIEIAEKRQKKVFEWTCSSGIVPAGASIQSHKGRNPATKDPLTALDLVIEQVEPAIFLFKDFHPFLTRTNYAVIRRLKDIALHLKNSFKTIVLISPVMEIPPELDKEITVINFPQPAKEDLAALLDKIIEADKAFRTPLVWVLARSSDSDGCNHCAPQCWRGYA